MTEVEELANKYFEEQCEHTYADTLEELKEDVVTAFLQGYAKGETDEKFRTKQVVTKDMAELKTLIEKMKCCGNCIHCYEGAYHNGYRCKDHARESVCDNWEIMTDEIRKEMLEDDL